VACGTYANGERGFTAFCLPVNPGFAGGAYGCANMGPYDTGQPGYLRVPPAGQASDRHLRDLVAWAAPGYP
jgi:hypothetical protein